MFCMSSFIWFIVLNDLRCNVHLNENSWKMTIRGAWTYLTGLTGLVRQKWNFWARLHNIAYIINMKDTWYHWSRSFMEILFMQHWNNLIFNHQPSGENKMYIYANHEYKTFVHFISTLLKWCTSDYMCVSWVSHQKEEGMNGVTPRWDADHCTTYSLHMKHKCNISMVCSNIQCHHYPGYWVVPTVCSDAQLHCNLVR